MHESGNGGKNGARHGNTIPRNRPNRPQIQYAIASLTGEARLARELLRKGQSDQSTREKFYPRYRQIIAAAECEALFKGT